MFSKFRQNTGCGYPCGCTAISKSQGPVAITVPSGLKFIFVNEQHLTSTTGYLEKSSQARLWNLSSDTGDRGSVVIKEVKHRLSPTTRDVSKLHFFWPKPVVYFSTKGPNSHYLIFTSVSARQRVLLSAVISR